jgi:molybdopterin-containing oxidoreductase family iron-sulfur binding subunit
MRWGMVIDLKKCVGCYACMISCKQENFIPPFYFWNRILIGETGKYPTVRKLVYPILCNHCEEPPCVDACPTGATFIREDGIVVIDYEKCMGCRSCLIACPYQQRSFYKDEQLEYFPGQGLTPYEEFGRELRSYKKGTVFKCDFCYQKIDKAYQKGLVPGNDIEATPACVLSCPAKARYFGDLDNTESEVCHLIRERKGMSLHPEFGTKPSVYYLDY